MIYTEHGLLVDPWRPRQRSSERTKRDEDAFKNIRKKTKFARDFARRLIALDDDADDGRECIWKEIVKVGVDVYPHFPLLRSGLTYLTL